MCLTIPPSSARHGEFSPLAAASSTSGFTHASAVGSPIARTLTIIVRPGYLDGYWTKASWTERGLRDKVGATHTPLPTLLRSFVDAGFVLNSFKEGGEPIPTVLAMRALKPE
jgi:hypothetical protein